MTQDSLSIVMDVVHDVTGIPRSELTPDTRMSQVARSLEEFHQIYENAAEASGADLNSIINSMPVYSTYTSDITLSSLQYVSAFSNKARKLLDRWTVRVDDETLQSIADSVAAEKYIPSGYYHPPAFTPKTIGEVVKMLGMNLFLMILLGFVIAAVKIFTTYGATGFSIGWLVLATFRGIIPFVGLFLILRYLFAFVPGLWATWHETGRKHNRHIDS